MVMYLFLMERLFIQEGTSEVFHVLLFEIHKFGFEGLLLSFELGNFCDDCSQTFGLHLIQTLLKPSVTCRTDFPSCSFLGEVLLGSQLLQQLLLHRTKETGLCVLIGRWVMGSS